MSTYLEPLAIAANVTQAATCRPDQVLVTFGMLYHFFLMRLGPGEHHIQRIMIESLEKRWAKMDQPVFIAAVILNPLLHFSLFSPSTNFDFATTLDMFNRLLYRFYPNDVTDLLQPYLNNYFSLTGIFACWKPWIHAEQVYAMNTVSVFFIYKLYSTADFSNV